MRLRLTPLLTTLLLATALLPGLTAPAAAQGSRLKLVSPNSATSQFPADINGWWSLIDNTGNLNIEPRFDWIGLIFDGQAPAALNGRFGIINGIGRWRVDPLYDHIDRFSEGYAVYRRDGKAGFFNAAGKEVLRPELEDARRFQDGLAAIRTATGCGYINEAMRVVVPPTFAVARSLHDGLGVVAIDAPRRDTAAARTLERFADAPLDELIDAEVLARAAAGIHPGTRLWGCVDRSGRMVWLDRTGRVEEMDDFGDNFAPVRIGEKWGFINRSFNLAIKPRWDEARPFVRGYAAVRLGEKWGYINVAGRVAIEPRWDEAFDFDETLALVRAGAFWGYIDVTGSVAIEPQFTEAESFFRGRARVNAGWDERPDAFGYIDISGRVVFDPRHGALPVVDLRIRGGRDGTVNGVPRNRSSRLITAPPSRPTPELDIITEHLYEEAVTVDDAYPVEGAEVEEDTQDTADVQGADGTDAADATPGDHAVKTPQP